MQVKIQHTGTYHLQLFAGRSYAKSMWGFVSQLVTKAFRGPEETGMALEEVTEPGTEQPTEPVTKGMDWAIGEGESAELVEAKTSMLLALDRPYTPPRIVFDAAVKMLDTAPETEDFNQVRADLYVIAGLCCQRLAMRKATEGMKSSKATTSSATQNMDDPDVDDWLAFSAEALQLAHELTPTDHVQDQLFLLSTLHATPLTDRAAAVYRAFSPAAKRGDARRAIASAKPIVESLTLMMGHQFKIRADAWRAQSRAFYMEAVHATTPVEELFNLEKAVEACVSLAEMRRARGTDLLLLLKAVKRVESLTGAPYVDVSILHTQFSPLTNSAFDAYDECDVFEATGTGPEYGVGESDGGASPELRGLHPPANSNSSNNSNWHEHDHRDKNNNDHNLNHDNNTKINNHHHNHDNDINHNHDSNTHRHHNPHNDAVNAHDPNDALVSNDANDDINRRASPDLHLPANNAHVDVAAAPIPIKPINTIKTVKTINPGRTGKFFINSPASVSARRMWEWLGSRGRRSGTDGARGGVGRGKALTPSAASTRNQVFVHTTAIEQQQQPEVGQQQQQQRRWWQKVQKTKGEMGQKTKGRGFEVMDAMAATHAMATVKGLIAEGDQTAAMVLVDQVISTFEGSSKYHQLMHSALALKSLIYAPSPRPLSIAPAANPTSTSTHAAASAAAVAVADAGGEEEGGVGHAQE